MAAIAEVKQIGVNGHSHPLRRRRLPLKFTMIHLQMQGLIGNNLFQYAFARILSEDLGYALEVTHSPYKAKQNVPQLIELLSHFRDAPLSIPGKSFEHPIDTTAQVADDGFDGHCIDLEKMRNRQDDRKLLIEGFFERYEIFRAHKDRIRSWYACDAINLGYNISEDDVVMHIRRGDFIVFGRALSLDFYLDVLKDLDFRQLYICGFGLDREVKQAFQRYNPIYVQGKPSDDFRFIKGFNRIIQSQSTFAWWAGFLSHARELYAPVPAPNSTPFEEDWPQIDLRVDDESRYHYVCNVPHLDRPLALRDVITARTQLPGDAFWGSLIRLGRASWGSGRERMNRQASRLLGRDAATTASWLRDYVSWELVYRRKRYKRGLYKFGGPDRLVLGKYKKIVIVRMNHSYAGFFACFTFALNQILFCERNDCLPVVYFGKWSGDGENAFYDEAHGPNVWDYYFEPVAGHGYEEIGQWLRDPQHPLRPYDVVTLTDEDLWYLHCFEKQSVFAYAYERYRLKTRFDAKWYDRQRRKAHELIQRRIHVKSDIRDRVDLFFREHMEGRHVLGMHLRGTDKGAAEGSATAKMKVGPELYFQHVDQYLVEHPDARLFVATDQVQYLDAIKERYGNRVLANDCLRSTDDIAPFEFEEASGYVKGAEVLTDALLLARCHYLLKCASHVGEAALWFDPNIPSLDLNYVS